MNIIDNVIKLIESDKRFNSLPLNEQLDITTYYYLCEAFDLNNIYPFKMKGNYVAYFLDNNNVTHFIRIMLQPYKNNPRYEVKFGFYDENRKPCFDRPNLHYNKGPDEKIFNTHIHIFLNNFLNRFFKESKINELFLPAIDYPRYRLYKIVLNKFLNKNLYNLKEIKDKYILVVVRQT